MTVVAIVPIRHGEADGTVREIGVGEEVTGLSDDEVRSLIHGGSAIEMGKTRKYTEAPPTEAAASADATLLRDELLRKSAAENAGVNAEAQAANQTAVAQQDAKNQA